MRGRFGRSILGAAPPLAALLAACLIGQASAGGLSPSPDEDSGARQAQCRGGAAEGCARIRGYIAAGSDVSAAETVGGRPAPFGPPSPPFMSSVDAAGRAAADAINRGLFFLQASHDDGLR